MFDELSFAEVEGQRPELLPTRTVLSMLGMSGGGGGGASANACSGNGNVSTGLLGIADLGLLNGVTLLSNCNAVAG
jgi:hypothetical protein